LSEARTLWALRALALALAILAWFFISLEGERRRERAFDASVQYNNPDPTSLMVLEPVRTVSVRLSGPVSRITTLNPLQVGVIVDLPDQTDGFIEVPLAAKDIIRPQGLDVVEINPNVLRLELDRIINDMKPVVPRLEGEPAAGAIAKTPEARPASVLVRGPESILNRHATVSTSPVNLDGHAIEFEERVAVVSPDPRIQVLQPAVVNVKIPLEIPNAPVNGTEDERETATTL
jgi:YbbR domain-containing protein